MKCNQFKASKVYGDIVKWSACQNKVKLSKSLDIYKQQIVMETKNTSLSLLIKLNMKKGSNVYLTYSRNYVVSKDLSG